MEYPAYKTILVQRDGGVATVTISRPDRRNAWNDDVSREIVNVFHCMDEDDDVRVAILTGNQEGKAFSAGADIKEPTAHTVSSLGRSLSRLHRGVRLVFDAVYEFPKPVIAAINGYAIGVGCQICLCCDLLYAAENAELGMPQVSLGLMPAYAGAIRLARFVGKGKAMEMALLGERITAQEGYRLGLINKVTPLPELMPAARRAAERLASLPPLAVKLTKESIIKGLDIPNVKDAAWADLYRFLVLEMTEDNLEAHRAWREKRPPVFKGQ
ncbi:MAG: enoyl-CoA hydratase/isomerase family protein [Chloroflexi bacterium]|nr:enoyl-CoA hydratase/isomerase family protein [Chloroflexota bacterium]